YTLRLTALAGTGAYTAGLTLNAVLEAEGYGGPSNDTLATAQPLDGSAVALQGTATRFGVLGATEGGSDFYSFSLAAGQVASLVVTPLSGGTPGLELQDASGTVLSLGARLSANPPGLVVHNFVAPAAGTYYVRVSGAAGQTYSLVVTEDAGLALNDRYFTDF